MTQETNPDLYTPVLLGCEPENGDVPPVARAMEWERMEPQASWQYWRTQVGWLEVQVWAHPHFDCSFFCPELGYKNYSTHTKDVEQAKETALIYVLTRLKSLFELAQKINVHPVTGKLGVEAKT